mmetsp:Transcript_7952/g.25423  ORF Transcript_7952/g.25423 Transcript_7952/m.25423 type:complete len:159 (-) Transcript_7952:28-504(-)
MSSIIRSLLALSLGAVFIFAGANKLTPSIDANMHAYLAKAFVTHAANARALLRPVAELANVGSQLTATLTAKNFLTFTGALETVTGLLLVLTLGAGRDARLARLLLQATMVGALAAHYRAGDPTEAMQMPGALLVGLTLLSAFQGEGGSAKGGKAKRA